MKNMIRSLAWNLLPLFPLPDGSLCKKELSGAKDSLFLFSLLLVIFIGSSSGGFLVCFWICFLYQAIGS